MPVLTATYAGGVASTLEVRGHKYVIDVPEEMGGEDRGPTPLDVLGASLGSCIVFYLARWCREANINCEGMHVEVTYEHDKENHCITQITAQTNLPSDFPASRRKAALRVAQQCTVHNTLCGTPSVEVSLA